MKVDSNEKYMNLITSEYATCPRFIAYNESLLEPLLTTNDTLLDFANVFNLDNAVGDQLDKCGELVALTRVLPFSNPDVPPILPDDLFKLVIKARIYSNHWDGTLEGLQQLIVQLFPQSSFEIVDNQDMSMQIIMINPGATPALLALLFNGWLVPKPAGVFVTWTIQEAALFGYDIETSFIKGWDEGKWASA